MNSRFLSAEIFDDIDNIFFLLLSKENEFVCLIGDLNSKASTLKDYN